MSVGVRGRTPVEGASLRAPEPARRPSVSSTSPCARPPVSRALRLRLGCGRAPRHRRGRLLRLRWLLRLLGVRVAHRRSPCERSARTDGRRPSTFRGPGDRWRSYPHPRSSGARLCTGPPGGVAIGRTRTGAGRRLPRPATLGYSPARTAPCDSRECPRELAGSRSRCSRPSARPSCCGGCTSTSPSRRSPRRRPSHRTSSLQRRAPCRAAGGRCRSGPGPPDRWAVGPGRRCDAAPGAPAPWQRRVREPRWLADLDWEP